jgi:outer membrane protein TolC
MILTIGAGVNSFGQELSYFLNLADQHSPELEAMRLEYDLFLEKKEEARALPDTELGVGLFVRETETRVGPQKARFSLRQMLPWFGSITARTNYADQLAEVEYLDWVISRRKLRLQVSLAYYELQAGNQRLEILKEQDQILSTLRELALASVRAGKSTATDVLRVDIRRQELLGQIQVLHSELSAMRFSFFRLLNVPETEIDVALKSLPDVLPEPEALEVGIHPELARYDRLFESVQAQELVNRKSAGPNLGLGIDYIPVAERTDMVLDENGKDILMPMVSVSIPIFNTRYQSQTRQNKIREANITASKQLKQNQLESLLAQAIQLRNAGKIKYQFQTENAGQIRQVLEIMLVQYQTASVSITDLLQTQQLALTTEMERIKALEAFLAAGARVNYLSEK